MQAPSSKAPRNNNNNNNKHKHNPSTNMPSSSLHQLIVAGRSSSVREEDGESTTSEGTATSRTMSLGPLESPQAHETKKRSSSHLDDDDNDDSGLETLANAASAISGAPADQSKPRKSPKLSHGGACEESATDSAAANRQLSVLKRKLGQLEDNAYLEMQKEVEELKGRLQKITEIDSSAYLQMSVLISMAREFVEASGELGEENRAVLDQCDDQFGESLPRVASVKKLQRAIFGLLGSH